MHLEIISASLYHYHPHRFQGKSASSLTVNVCALGGMPEELEDLALVGLYTLSNNASDSADLSAGQLQGHSC